MKKILWIDVLNSNLIRFVLAFILCFSVLLIFLFSIFLENNSDPTPKMEFITGQTLKEFGQFSTPVKVGLYIKAFPVFNVNNNSFKIDAAVWFQYNPMFVDGSLLNNFSFLDGVIEYKSDPDKKILSGMVFVKYDVIVDIKSNLRFDHYPYCSHKIFLILLNNYLTTSEAYFVADDSGFNINPRIIISNWEIDYFSADYGYRLASFDRIDTRKTTSSPVACFEIGISPCGVKDILILIIPMLFIMLLSLLFLLIPLNKNYYKSDMSIAILPLSTFIAFRFVINTVMPDVGYSTIADNIFTGILVLIFLIFIVNLINLIYVNKNEAEFLLNDSKLIVNQNIF